MRRVTTAFSGMFALTLFKAGAVPSAYGRSSAAKLLERHARNVRDVESRELDRQRFAPQPLAMAHAGNRARA